MRLPFRNRRGEPYEGAVVRCSERGLVPWPGLYGVKRDRSGGEKPDPSCPLEAIVDEDAPGGVRYERL